MSYDHLCHRGYRFDPAFKTVLQTDASRLRGIEYEGVWRLMQCGLRFLSDTESSDPSIEDTSLGEETSICVRNVVATKIAMLHTVWTSVIWCTCLGTNSFSPECIGSLHDSHRGIEATKRRARQVVWWPAINSDITNTVRAYQLCQVFLPSQQKEPIYDEDTVPKLFESASADFFSTAGKSYIVYVDWYSGWPVIRHCGTDNTTAATIRFFRTFFRDLGVPVRPRNDGGRQFTSHDFTDFLRRWGPVQHISSPHYQQSNGHAEAAVKAVKHFIMKVSPSGNIKDCEAFDRGLLEIRNTPRPDGRSPTQILYGRQLRSCVPAHAKSFATEWQTKITECGRRAAAQALDAVARYNARAKTLPPVKIGSYERILNPAIKRWDKDGTVMGQGETRDYLFRTAANGVLWRNRRFLRTIPAPKDGTFHAQQTPREACDQLVSSSDKRQKCRRSARLLTKS
ncbi:uncharacterized protein [Penaeus vannamei]|uniref:uncharacterized protein n=1 Tax=Penaeus vannamei TaxID=6689 RepID=UPI00387FB1B0